MQIKLSKAKSLLEQYIHSEGRHWKAKVRSLVDDAFFAYNGQSDYLKLTWDDFGLDTIAVVLQDKLDNQLSLDETRFSDCVAGLEKLSSFVRSTYAKYEEVPELVLDEVVSGFENAENEDDGKAVNNTKSEAISNKLRDYTKNMVIQFSYKPLLVKAIVHLSRDGDTVNLNDVLTYFLRYYTEKYLLGYPRENGLSIFSKLNSSKLLALDVIRKNPIQILSQKGLLSLASDGYTISIPRDVYLEIRQYAAEIRKNCDQVLDAYYNRLSAIEDKKFSVYEFTNPYGRKKIGITRSECKSRLIGVDQCAIVASELSFEEANNYLNSYQADIERINYFNHPLHILQFDKSGQLINSFDSILEASCLLGIRKSYIKSCCKKEVDDSKYIWEYGESYIAAHITVKKPVPINNIKLDPLSYSDERKIGQIVQDSMQELERKGYVFTQHQLDALLSLVRSKELFKLYYPFFKILDDSKSIEAQCKDRLGYARYWNNIYSFNGKKFLITSQWYKESKVYFISWFNKLMESEEFL